MADNFTANPGVGGDTFAADDVSGVKYPRSKIDAGGDGVSVPIVAGQQTMSVSLPIVIASDQSAITVATHAVTQSGTWTVILGAGAAAIGSVTVSNASGASAVNIQDGGNSITVDGTVTANAGTGTFAISAASLPLPTGAATSAKQPALGTAGSASTDVITVQGIASGTAQPVSGTVSITANSSVNVAQMNGVTTSMGNGTTDTGTQRVSLSSDSTGQVKLAAGAAVIGAVTQSGTWNIGSITTLPTLANVTTVATVTTVSTLTNITNWGNIVDNAAFTDGTTRLSMGGYILDEVAGTALTENDAAAARIDSKRAQVITIEDATTRGQRMAVDPTGSISAARGQSTTYWNYAAAAGGLVSTAGVTAKSSAGASVRNYIGSIDVVNSHATIGTDVQIRDGASGTVLWRGYAAAAGGGVSRTFDPPLRGSAATLVEIAEGTATSTTGVYVNLTGWTGA